jgi:dTDP-glucose 4,6-dehydratase
VVNLDALKYSGNLENLADLAGHPQYAFVHADIGNQTSRACTILQDTPH